MGLRLAAVAHRGGELRRLLGGEAPHILLLAATLDEPLDGVDLLEEPWIPSGTAVVLLVLDPVDDELRARLQQVEVDGVLAWPAKRAQLELTLHASLRARRERVTPLREHLERTTDALQRIAQALAGVAHLIPAVPVQPLLRPLPELASLSPREWEVLRGLVGHQRVSTLARELDISPHTVRNHLKSIFAKLSVHSQVELLEKVVDKRATRMGLERPVEEDD